MCLGVPGKIVRRWQDEKGALLAEADFVGERRVIALNYLPDLHVGDHTIVHAGFALTRLTPEDAAATIATMREVGLLPEEPLSADLATSTGSTASAGSTGSAGSATPAASAASISSGAS